MGGLGETDKDTVVDLEQAEELQDLTGLWAHLVDTLDTDDKGELGLGRHVVGARGASNTLQSDLLELLCTVLADVLFGTLESKGAGSLPALLCLCVLGSLGGTCLFNCLALLEDVKGDGLLGGNDDAGDRPKGQKVSLYMEGNRDG